jgi:hypothetical protein
MSAVKVEPVTEPEPFVQVYDVAPTAVTVEWKPGQTLTLEKANVIVQFWESSALLNNRYEARMRIIVFFIKGCA